MRFCILFLRDGREHRSQWFTTRNRALRAKAVIERRYGAAVLYRD
jgi:hypothetical protein